MTNEMFRCFRRHSNNHNAMRLTIWRHNEHRPNEWKILPSYNICYYTRPQFNMGISSTRLRISTSFFMLVPLFSLRIKRNLSHSWTISLISNIDSCQNLLVFSICIYRLRKRYLTCMKCSTLQTRYPRSGFPNCSLANPCRDGSPIRHLRTTRGYAWVETLELRITPSAPDGPLHVVLFLILNNG